MRLSGPTLRDELRGTRLRSLRMFLLPAILGLALYAFYAIGGYGAHDTPTPAPVRHGNIYGTVLDEKQHPVPGVSVTISFSSVKEPLPDSTPTTDADGHFYLQDLPPGRYILQATADGFDMQTQSLVVDSGATVQIKMPIYHKASPTPRLRRVPPPQ